MREFFKVLGRFIPPYKTDLILNFVYNVLGALFGVFSFFMLKPVLEKLFETDTTVVERVPWALSKDAIFDNLNYYITQVKVNYSEEIALLAICGLLVIMVFMKVLFTYLASYKSVGIRNGVVRDIRSQIYDKIIALPIGYFTEERKGDIISRTTGDVQEVENSVMTSLDMFLKNPVLILASLAGMLIMSVKMTLFVFILLPVAGYIIGRVGRSLKKTSRRGQNKMGELLSTIEETLSGLRVIKAFNAEDHMNARYDDENNEYRRIMNSLMRRRVLAHPMSELLGTIVIVVVLWYGGRLILNENSTMSASDFITFLVVFYGIINPAKAFSQAFYSIQKGLAAMDRIDDILYAESPIKEAEKTETIGTFDQGIEYDNVTFAYGTEDVLKNVSVSIPRGKMVALVGQSGSGKSTFVDLLPRFYDVKAGAIKVNGVDIKKASMKELRGLIGYVNQEPILFNDSFFNNIAFGVENASMEDVIAAAKVANAHDFIEASEDGYHTNIGDRGSKLSGGQRQRLSIARAVLKNPPILILDEATSALDTESEKLVQQALENLMKDRTSLVVAHRLSTIKNADQICVFHEGKVVERGTHDELLKLNKVYSKLHEMQAL
ncbi:ABC transporter ATP-binding protein [Prolixibacteraceae bacterium JC049]|nr:ABC transporter ATP-binding protein [Prolixibacteraceae bacterium JC049]